MMMLAAKNISHAYTAGVPVLKGISLTLARGTILYLLGRNGCGKTTLMQCLSGTLRPESGEITFEGKAIHAYTPTERAQRIGLIPQLHAPSFAYTVREMILMGRAPHLGVFGTPSKADYAIANDALASVGLAHYRDRPYTQLSGGERQLVLIARGLAQKCRILLMDEPDAHLDLNNQQRVMEIVQQLAAEGLSFIVTSHVPNNALLYAHRVLLMKAGRVLSDGDPTHTLTEPLLSDAYEMATEVIYETLDETRIARAILPRRRL
ncbi:MAG: ABC transporter ATP-binding protein [Chloroflexi bacterium CFX4]|nr:ABC transporter ATP-binding protein [Chloroflexi bacterium CFX4]MDL1922617.1 ABC transporter ATP-binding protein [Chloroflexi bacterium CFX3]